LKERQRVEAMGVGLIALGTLISLAVIPPTIQGAGAAGNLIGPAGEVLHLGLSTIFGVTAVLVGVPAFVWGVRCFGMVDRQTAIRWSILSGGALLLVPAAWWLLSTSVSGGRSAAGWLGRSAGGLLHSAFGSLGSQLIVVALVLSLAVLTLGWSPARTAGGALMGLGRAFSALSRWLRPAFERVRSVLPNGRAVGEESELSLWERKADEQEPRAETIEEREAKLDDFAEKETAKAEDRSPDDLPDSGDTSQDALPPLQLLTLPAHTGPGLGSRELERLGQIVVDKLRTFRVEGRIGGWTTGPVVTQFEVIPAEGVKVGQIAALADDLALALKAPSVRIVAPLPGKGAVGVEVPNPEPEIVHLREILEAPEYERSRAVLPLALGRDLDGNPYCADLASMPHLLIAGATGSGKSVCINTIVTSLIYRYPPRDLRLLMVDPKMVELVVYNDLPHLRHPVVTDNQDAAAVLRWAVFEMSRRYSLLSANSCRNLHELNARIDRSDGVVMPAARGGGEYTQGRIPFIVLVIDELADLIMTVQSEVETPLALLAQKARAVGMHMVVATQRPSVNVVTGLIKANFPSRMAFRVASKIDSRTILDQNGAESLLGNGDMLFLPPAESDPHRVQGAFIATAETERLIEWYREQAERRRETEAAREADILDEVRALELEDTQVDLVDQALADWDPYFLKAAEIVINNSSGSTSLLQRRLKIGYGRAARIIDQLHTAGVLGPPDGSRPREVLMTHEQVDGLLHGEEL
jgi:S-DNA-T family DNA segregation ATPase FtsK/SpoIIIE